MTGIEGFLLGVMLGYCLRSFAKFTKDGADVLVNRGRRR